jgi:hypothetical protein
MNIQAEYNRLQLKRQKFRRASLACGVVVALGVFWSGPLGQILGITTVYLWLMLLICGFVFRSIAVNARNTAKVMEAQLASQGLTPNLSPINTSPVVEQVQAFEPVPAPAPSAPAPSALPATASEAPKSAPAKPNQAPEANIESRLAKARRLNN